MPPQRAFHRLPVPAFLERERGVGQLGQELIPGDPTQVHGFGVRVRHLLGHAGEIPAFAKHAVGAPGGILVVEHHHLQPAPLGPVELVLAGLEGFAERLIGDGDLLGQVFRRQGDGGERPVLGRGEAARIVLVKRRQRLLVGLRDAGHGAVRHPEHVGDALLLAVIVHGRHQRARRRRAGLDAFEELGPHQVSAHQRDVSVLGQPVGLKGLFEAGPVEHATAVAEGLGVADLAGHQVVADGHAEGVGALGEQDIVDHPAQHRVRKPQGPRPFQVQIAAEHGAQASHLTLEFRVELVGPDFHVPDLGHRRRAGAGAKDVADAPDGEADDEQAKETLDEDRGGTFADGFQHGRDRWLWVWRGAFRGAPRRDAPHHKSADCAPQPRNRRRRPFAVLEAPFPLC